MRRCFLAILTLGLTLGAMAGSTAGQELVRIAAVVNDDVISVLDLEGRVNMALLVTGMPNTPDVRDQLRSAVMRNLIEELLQIQEAERSGITVSSAELNESMQNIARENGLPVTGLESYMRTRGIPISSLRIQVEAQLAWAKFLNQQVRGRLSVTEDEIDSELQRLRANRGNPEYLLSEIDLYFDQSGGRDEALVTARRLLAQIEGGGNFSAVAQQFSQGSMAGAGGDLGWVLASQLQPEVAGLVETLTVGQVSAPVETLDAVHIVLLRDRRTITDLSAGDPEVRLMQVLLPDDGTDPPAVMAAAESIAASVSGCDHMGEIIGGLGDTPSGEIGWVKMGDLPTIFRGALDGLPVGQPTPAIRTDVGIHVLMACENRNNASGSTVDERELITQRLIQIRLGVTARRMLRDLRRLAYVEVRG